MTLDQTCGGAVLAIDIHTGAVLAAASGPRFDPNAFIGGDSAEVQRLLSDAARPLLDRTTQMALPPGSVFKIISACALLAGGIDPTAPVDCQGYLHQPEALRCAVFRKYGVGHGAVTLTEALARSCNVYFFHNAEQLGPAPLVEWAQRLGLGAASGIDLPGEAAGALPNVNTARSQRLTIRARWPSAKERSPPPRCKSSACSPRSPTTDNWSRRTSPSAARYRPTMPRTTNRSTQFSPPPGTPFAI